MAQPREPWNIRPAKKRASVTASLKTEVETKAKELIETVLKPRHVLPPPKEKQGNSIIDIGAKWYRGRHDVLPQGDQRPGNVQVHRVFPAIATNPHQKGIAFFQAEFLGRRPYRCEAAVGLQR